MSPRCLQIVLLYSSQMNWNWFYNLFLIIALCPSCTVSAGASELKIRREHWLSVTLVHIDPDAQHGRSVTLLKAQCIFLFLSFFLFFFFLAVNVVISNFTH